MSGTGNKLSAVMCAALASLALTACGGDDDDGGGGGPDGGATADAGPPDAPVAVGLTARGVFAGAVATARGMSDDAVLFEVTSSRISGGGEVATDNAQSFWSYAFLSPTTGDRINVIYNQGVYQSSSSTISTELPTIGDDAWIDSDVALQKAAAAGFVAPSGADSHLAMKLSPEMLFMDVPDPHWEIEKITAPPGEDVMVERWFVVFVSGDSMYVACLEGTEGIECMAVP